MNISLALTILWVILIGAIYFVLYLFVKCALVRRPDEQASDRRHSAKETLIAVLDSDESGEDIVVV